MPKIAHSSPVSGFHAKRLYNLIGRARQYRRRYGWRHFFTHLFRFWVWLPRLGRPIPKGTVPSLDQPFGVNVIGYLSGFGSFAEVARLIVESFEAAGVPVARIDLTSSNVSDPRHLPLLHSQRRNPYSSNVLITSSPRPPFDVEEILGSSYQAGRTNVSIWTWEFPQILEKSAPDLSSVDEVWVPSSFNSDSALLYSDVPVVCVPHPMRVGIAPESVHPAMLSDIPEDATIFLFVFQYHKLGYERKNPCGLIEAFRRAFATEENVWLVIKSEFSAAQEAKRALEICAAGLNVYFLDMWLTREQLDGLIARCDCYVSLHRAEGFGMTVAEAMAFAKPVIATAYSGNLEFMTHANSYLVDYRLIKLGRQYERSAWNQEWLWADPDLDQAAAYMRHVYEHQDEAQRLGRRAREDIAHQLSLEGIGKMMKERLLMLEFARMGR